MWSIWAGTYLAVCGVFGRSFGFWLCVAIVVVGLGTHKTCYVYRWLNSQLLVCWYPCGYLFCWLVYALVALRSAFTGFLYVAMTCQHSLVKTT